MSSDQLPTPNAQLPTTPNSQFPIESCWELGFGIWEWLGVGIWQLGVENRGYFVPSFITSRIAVAVGGELTMFMPRCTPSVILSGVHPLPLGRSQTSIRAPFSER